MYYFVRDILINQKNRCGASQKERVGLTVISDKLGVSATEWASHPIPHSRGPFTDELTRVLAENSRDGQNSQESLALERFLSEALLAQEARARSQGNLAPRSEVLGPA